MTNMLSLMFILVIFGLLVCIKKAFGESNFLKNRNTIYHDHLLRANGENMKEGETEKNTKEALLSVLFHW